MNENILEFPDRPDDGDGERKAIEAEASAWLVRMDGDAPLTQAERVALREWMGRSPAHKDDITAMAAHWGGLNILTELAVPLGSPRRARDRRGSIPNLASIINGALRPGFAYSALAVFALITAITVFFLLPLSDARDNGFYATAIGERETVRLADGSEIVLNTNSQIDVEFGGAFRDIRLIQGEALFAVAKDPDHPFRVLTRDGVFEAVGTAFSVYVKEGGVDLTVTEGVVGVASRHRLEFRRAMPAPAESEFDLGVVKAGQAAQLKASQDKERGPAAALGEVRLLDEKEIAKKLSWRKGYLTFTGEPLSEAIEEISRYTPLSIELADPQVGGIRVGGQFPVDKPDAVLAALETNFGLRATRAGENHVVLSAAQ